MDPFWLPRRRARREREARLDQLYLRQTQVEAILRNMVGNPQLARDAAAYALSEVGKRTEEIPDDPQQELAWLVRVGHNWAKNRRRSQQRERALVEKVQYVTPNLAYEHDADEQNLVLEAFKSLPLEQQELLRQAAWGVTTAEMAVELDVTVNAANVRLTRARMQLREAISRLEREGGDG